MQTLRFIRRARDLGLPIEHIRLLVGLWRDRRRSSADVKRIALGHVAALDAKLAGLTAMRDTLRERADACYGAPRPECPFLRDLAGGGMRTPARMSRPPVDPHHRVPPPAHAG